MIQGKMLFISSFIWRFYFFVYCRVLSIQNKLSRLQRVRSPLLQRWVAPLRSLLRSPLMIPNSLFSLFRSFFSPFPLFFLSLYSFIWCVISLNFSPTFFLSYIGKIFRPSFLPLYKKKIIINFKILNIQKLFNFQIIKKHMYVIVKNYYYMYLIIKIIFNCIISFHFKRYLALLNLKIVLVTLLFTLNMYIFLLGLALFKTSSNKEESNDKHEEWDCHLRRERIDHFNTFPGKFCLIHSCNLIFSVNGGITLDLEPLERSSELTIRVPSHE